MHYIPPMLFLPLSILLIALSLWLDLSIKLPSSLQSVHFACLKYTQFGDSIAYNLRQALVCGKRVPVSDVKTVFLNSGLIHLLVISGAHLNTLEYLISKIMFHKPRTARWLTYICFILLNLTCQFQAPCLRALFQKIIQDLNQRYKLFLTPIHEVMYAGTLCVCLLPIMTMSHSLILSWWISLCLKLPIKSNLNKCIFIYVSLIPWQASFMDLPTISILTNWLLAPTLSLIMTPLALFETLFPIVHKLTAFIWELIFYMLQMISAHSPSQHIKIPLFVFWIYLLGLQLFLLRKSLWSTYQKFSISF